MAALAGPLAADVLVLQEGRFAYLDVSKRKSPLSGGEYRWSSLGLPGEWHGLAPTVGHYRTGDEATYSYAGLHWDLPLGAGFHFTPQVTGGYFDRGDGKTLGATLQFESSLELSYELTPSLRVHTSLRHISNAGLSKPNPGEESLLFGMQWVPPW